MNILAEYDGVGALKARYTQSLGIDQPISMTRDAATNFYHFDGLGSVTRLTDANQNVTDTYTYDAFGNIVVQTGTTENPYRFTAREPDPDSGLMYYRARYYSPQVGRFITLDPMIGDARDPLSLNRYVYTQNNPLNYRDWTGRRLPGDFPEPPSWMPGWVGPFLDWFGNKFNQFACNMAYGKNKNLKEKRDIWNEAMCDEVGGKDPDNPYEPTDVDRDVLNECADRGYLDRGDVDEVLK